MSTGSSYAEQDAAARTPLVQSEQLPEGAQEKLLSDIGSQIKRTTLAGLVGLAVMAVIIVGVVLCVRVVESLSLSLPLLIIIENP